MQGASGQKRTYERRNKGPVKGSTRARLIFATANNANTASSSARSPSSKDKREKSNDDLKLLKKKDTDTNAETKKDKPPDTYDRMMKEVQTLKPVTLQIPAKETPPSSPLRIKKVQEESSPRNSPRASTPTTKTPYKQVFYKLGPREIQTSISTYMRPYSVGSSYFNSLLGKAEGFKNLGNTCYMNAVLQAVLSFDCFVADLQSNAEPLQPLFMSDSFCPLLLDVAKRMRRTNHGVIDLKLLKNAIDRNLKAFAGWAQQDAHEFFGSCLTYLEEEIAKLKNDVNTIGEDKTEEVADASASKITAELEEKQQKILERRAIMESLKMSDNPFFAQLTCPTTLNFNCAVRHEYLCDSCNRSSFVNETCRELSLEVLRSDESGSNQSVSILSLLKGFFTDEDVERTCETCLNERANASHKFIQLPRVLVVHLKRFKANSDTKTVDKLSNIVQIEKELSLDFACNRYTFNPKKASEYKPEKIEESRGKGKEKEEEKKSFTGMRGTSPMSKKWSSPNRAIVDDEEDSLESIMGVTPKDSELQKAIQLSKQQHEKDMQKKKAAEVFAFDSQSSSPDELAKALKLSLQSYQDEESMRKEQEELEAVLLASKLEAEGEGDVLLDISMVDEDEGTANKRKRRAEADDATFSTEPGNVNGNDEGIKMPEEKKRRLAKRKHRDEEAVAEDKSKNEKDISGALEKSSRQATLLFCDDDGEELKEPDEPCDSRYSLRCIVSHIGKAAAAGHYVADVYDPSTQKWQNFNDSRVTDVTEKLVLGEDRQQNGYLLFYLHVQSCRSQ